MLCDVKNGEAETKDGSSDIGFLEQTFNKLSLEGKVTLKKFMQTMVAIQNTAIETDKRLSTFKEKGVALKSKNRTDVW